MSARTFVRSLKSVGIILLVSMAASSPASAEVSLAVRDGRVFLIANDATVGEILAEWAKVGQTRIINVDHIPPDRVTLELTNVSEQHALDVLLRRASGYIAASRAIADPNASQFDRIIVMPPSVAPQTMAAAPSAATLSAPQTTAAAPSVATLSAPPADDVASDQTRTYEVPHGPGQPHGQGQPNVAAAPPAAASGNATIAVDDQQPHTAQKSFATRQALEVVDPREFRFPAQPPAAPVPLLRVPGPPGAIRR